MKNSRTGAMTIGSFIVRSDLDVARAVQRCGFTNVNGSAYAAMTRERYLRTNIPKFVNLFGHNERKMHMDGAEVAMHEDTGSVCADGLTFAQFAMKFKEVLFALRNHSGSQTFRLLCTTVDVQVTGQAFVPAITFSGDQWDLTLALFTHRRVDPGDKIVCVSSTPISTGLFQPEDEVMN